MAISTVSSAPAARTNPHRSFELALAAARTALENRGQQVVVLDMREQTQLFDYFVLAGDGRSAEYRVEVVERPRIEAISLELTPPAYAHQPVAKRPDSDGQVDGLCGTQVKLSLRASKPLKSAIRGAD